MQNKLFICDQCGKEGKSSVAAPAGWLTGIIFPASVAGYEKMTWAITLCLVPSRVQEEIAAKTPQRWTLPVTPGYLQHEFHICSAECLSQYLAKKIAENNEELDRSGKSLVTQIKEAAIEVLKEARATDSKQLDTN
jgi:hypothetical protein